MSSKEQKKILEKSIKHFGSQRALAESLKVSEQYVSNLKNLDKKMGFKTAYKLQKLITYISDEEISKMLVENLKDKEESRKKITINRKK